MPHEEIIDSKIVSIERMPIALCLAYYVIDIIVCIPIITNNPCNMDNFEDGPFSYFVEEACDPVDKTSSDDETVTDKNVGKLKKTDTGDCGLGESFGNVQISSQPSDVNETEDVQNKDDGNKGTQYRSNRKTFPICHFSPKYTSFITPNYPQPVMSPEDTNSKGTQSIILNISDFPSYLRTLHNNSGIILAANEPYYLWPFTSLLAEEVSEDIIETHAVDHIQYNGTPIAVVCPMCHWITCNGHSDHKLSPPEHLPTIANLPVEVFDKILSFFSLKELCDTIAPVCKSWRSLAYNSSCWMDLDLGPYSKLSTAWLNFLLKRHGHLVRTLRLDDRKLSIIDVSLWSRHLTVLEKLCYKAYACKDIRFAIYKILQTNCGNLKSLTLTGDTKIGRHQMRLICKWPLESVLFEQCKRIDVNTLIYMLKRLQSIKHLDLRGEKVISNCVIKALCAHQASSLRAFGCNAKNLSDAALAQLPQLTRLHTLCLDSAVQLTNKCVPHIAKLHGLKQLHISNACKITENQLLALFAEDGGVQSPLSALTLSRGMRVTDQVVRAVVRACGESLTYLDLAETHVTDLGLALLIYNCRYLSRLCLDGNKHLAGDNLLEVKHHLPRLAVLEMRECVLINKQSAYELQCAMPQLTLRTDIRVMKRYKLKLV